MSEYTTRNYKHPSQRELEILNLIASELTINEIAVALYISPDTVKTHRRRLLAKMDVRNTAGLIRKAFERKILVLEGQVTELNTSL